MKRLTKVLALLLTLTMVAAGCGSDDDGDAAPAAAVAPATTAAPAPAATEAPAEALSELNVAYFLEWPTANQVAQVEQTYDARLGMTVNWLPFGSGGDMALAMESGDIDIAYSQGLTPFANFVTSGSELEIVGVAVSYADADNCVAHPDYGVTAANAAETLAGQKVYAPVGNVTHYKLLKMLGHLGVALDSFEHVPSDGGAAAVAAFESGDVAMACAFGGGVLRMLAAGGNLVMTGSEQEDIGIRVFDIISIPTQFGVDHPNVVETFLQVTEEANAAYAGDRGAQEGTIAEAAGMTVEGSNALLDMFSFPDRATQLSDAWLGGTVQDVMKQQMDFFVEQGEIPEALDSYDSFVNTSFLEAIDDVEVVVVPTAYDYGVTDDTIRIGAIADLSGIFAPLVIQIIDAQTSYWNMVNENGGIDGKQVDFVVMDNGYDVPLHLERYEAMKDKDSGVVFLSQSTGSPHTAAIAESLVEDGLGAIPLSWYSGWPDPAFGQNVFESYTNYCYEAMNGVDWLANNVVEGDTKLAVISYPGEYGQDGATGAKMAAEALGIEVVYDGEGAAIPGADQTPVIAGLIESGANLVWATVGPGVFAEIFGGAAAQGFMPVWSGNSPTYNYMLLATPLAPALDAVYYQSSYVLAWNTGDAPGMEKMVAELQARIPDKPLSDVYAVGWTEAMAAHQILETAAKNKDMTRAGVIAAANETVVNYQGLAPNQGYGGEVNDFIVRESYIFDIQADLFDVAATVASGGSTGSVMLAGGPIMSDQARDHVYEGACFSAG
ncbi:MAG: ABC transporter substrate-binding protein [Acidimicrobiales bacterium]|nr:ABC transporter substrate-binding protein [Acidimicrobiales bacterium]